jgi:hypothetical protein
MMQDGKKNEKNCAVKIFTLCTGRKQSAQHSSEHYIYIYMFFLFFLFYKSERSTAYSAVETVCYSGSFDKYFRRKVSAQIQQEHRVNIASSLRCGEIDTAASICMCGPAGRIRIPIALNTAHLQNFFIVTTRNPDIPRRASLCSNVIVIPLLTKIIPSGITLLAEIFVSRNVISLLAVWNVNNLVGFVGLPYVMWSAHFFVTNIQTEKISSWNCPTVHVCCFMLARASTKTFVSRNVISLLAVSNVNNPVGLVGLPYVMWSAHFFVTHTQRRKR